MREGELVRPGKRLREIVKMTKVNIIGTSMKNEFFKGDWNFRAESGRMNEVN